VSDRSEGRGPISPTVVYGRDVSRMPVRDLPGSMRPREMLERFGAEKIPTEALLAVILRSGVRGANVLKLARDLLGRYGSLMEMSRVSEGDLARFPGIGPVKAQVLKAALELGRRMAAESACSVGDSIRSAADAAAVLRPVLISKETETFVVLLLDTRNRLKRPPVEVTRGILDASLIHPREVFREAVRNSASAVILGHNHPSGDCRPSAEDVRITRELVSAGQVVQIRVLDHIIIGRAGAGGSSDFASLRELGVVEFSD